MIFCSDDIQVQEKSLIAAALGTVLCIPLSAAHLWVAPHGDSGHTCGYHSFLMMARQMCIAPSFIAGVLYVSGLTSSSLHLAFSCSFRAYT